MMHVMKLRDWLTTNKKSDQYLADRLGVHRMTIWRYRTGETTPDKDMLNRIFAETGGAVTANDFIHDAPVEAAE